MANMRCSLLRAARLALATFALLSVVIGVFLVIFLHTNPAFNPQRPQQSGAGLSGVAAARLLELGALGAQYGGGLVGRIGSAASSAVDGTMYYLSGLAGGERVTLLRLPAAAHTNADSWQDFRLRAVIATFLVRLGPSLVIPACLILHVILFAIIL